jgi:hypothetical protein
MEKKIFVSYAHENKNNVNLIVNKLKLKFSVWIDYQELSPGVDLNQKITDGIRNSDLFICFITKSYCHSKACKRECTLADNLNKTILPVILERPEISSIDFIISTLNKLYAFKPPNVFDPWSDDFYQRFEDQIFYLISNNDPVCYLFSND